LSSGKLNPRPLPRLNLAKLQQTVLFDEGSPLGLAPLGKTFGGKLEHLDQLEQGDVVLDIEIKEPIGAIRVPGHDLEPKEFLLILVDLESVDVGCGFVCKLAHELILQLLLLFVQILHLALIFVADVVHVLQLEVDLVVGAGVLVLLAAQKWLIHAVLVLQVGHVASLRPIVVTVQLLHLRLTLMSCILQLVLVALINFSRLLHLLRVLISLRAHLFMRLTLFERLEHVLDIEGTVTAARLPVRLVARLSLITSGRVVFGALDHRTTCLVLLFHRVCWSFAASGKHKKRIRRVRGEG